LICLPEDEAAAVAEEAAGFDYIFGKEVFIMPGFNGMGPRGEGPMTGGARGYCNPGYAGYGRGYGLGRGFRGGFGAGTGWGRGYGRGYGRRGGYYPSGRWFGPAYGAPYADPYTMKPEDEIDILKDEAAAMKNDLDTINRRIEEIESQSSES
jgi:hypothetical protein